MDEYQPRVMTHCSNLITQLSARVGEPVNIPNWVSYFGFDMMGDLVFGKSFNMANTAGDHFIFNLFAKQQPFTGLLQCISWLFMLFLRLPFVSGRRPKWIGWCADQVHERKKAGKSRNDLFSYIRGDETESQKTQKTQKVDDIEERDLIFDSELAIIGGSDTTSTTLTVILYLLAKKPDKLTLLQNELDEILEPGEDVSHQKLTTNAPYLTGVINEALRLWPAVPSGLQRITPPSGATIAGRYIPGDTIISTPCYTMHRDPRWFEQAEEFIPERWSSQPELIHNKNAFSPFLIGSYSCVGKNLAFLEMRLLTYYIVKKFSFEFPPGADKDVMGLSENSKGFRDFFVAKVPAFDLVFHSRD